MTLIKGLIQIIKEKRTLYFYQKKSGSSVTCYLKISFISEIELNDFFWKKSAKIPI